MSNNQERHAFKDAHANATAALDSRLRGNDGGFWAGGIPLRQLPQSLQRFTLIAPIHSATPAWE